MGRTSDARARLISSVGPLLLERGYHGTTIDAICERARVRKGTFYHFFSSKEDLVIAALETDRAARRDSLDSIFSPTRPPLCRLQLYCERVYARQREAAARHGQVPGCPLFTLGAEVCAQEERLREQINAALADYLTYFASALREAAGAGQIEVPDPNASARSIFALIQGAITQARIANDAEILRELPSQVFGLLGLKPVPSAA